MACLLQTLWTRHVADWLVPVLTPGGENNVEKGQTFKKRPETQRRGREAQGTRV